MENSFKGIVDQSNSILIVLPLKSDFDTVAAGLSLYLALREEKEVQVYSPSPMIVEFNRLVGINKISTELGNKNLIIEFSDYKAEDIERVSYDIKEGQFKLTVIPKAKVAPPVKDSVHLSYSGISSDLIIIVGGKDDSDFPSISGSELAGASLVHVGTKDVSLSGGRNYTSFASPASSISEIVSSLINESGLRIDEDAATNLIMGIEKATNFFADQSVNADTFGVISDLMRKGGRRMAKPVVQTQNFGSSPRSPLFGSPKPVSKPVPQNVYGNKNFNQNKGNDNLPQGGWMEPKIYKGTSTS